MELNANFTQRAIVHGASIPWQPSPIPGVERRMLDRIGDEVARATSIVRYAPGSQFSPHTHGGGEEFLVLEGVFQDEHGDYPVGTYVRNPPTSRHTPGSELGCVILVKLWQFDPDDRIQIAIDITKQTYRSDLMRPGVSRMLLFSDDRETVGLEYWDATAEIDLWVTDGLEIFVIEGSFWESNQEFQRYSWLRLPVGSRFSARSQGCQVWLKQGKFRIF
ncbi:MAG: cupin domain-containing protein [Cyanobacteria bacterium]|nr:cupin domain-containing protein [Cyanobacteriota bacterium]